jgi:hypothetical protein
MNFIVTESGKISELQAIYDINSKLNQLGDNESVNETKRSFRKVVNEFLIESIHSIDLPIEGRKDYIVTFKKDIDVVVTVNIDLMQVFYRAGSRENCDNIVYIGMGFMIDICRRIQARVEQKGVIVNRYNNRIEF